MDEIPARPARRKYALAAFLVLVIGIGGMFVVQVVKERVRAAQEQKQQEEREQAEVARKQLLEQSRSQANALCEEALDAASTLPRNAALDELLVVVARTQALAQRGTAAMATVGRYSDERVRPHLLADVALILSLQASTAGVDSIFHPALEAARASSNDRFRVNALAYVARQQSQVTGGNGATETLQEAIKVARGITDEVYESNRWLAALAWKDIGMAQVSTGDLAGALASAEKIPLQDMDFIGTTVFVSRVEVLVAIANASLKAGDKQHGLQTLQLALSAVKRVSEVNRWGELHKIVEAQIEHGDRAGARATLAEALTVARTLRRRVSDEDLAFGMLSIVAISLSQAGDVPGALGLSGEISDKGWAARTLANIAVAMKETHAPDSAQIILRESLAMVGTMAGGAERDALLGDIAESQALAGDVAGALETARSALNVRRRAIALFQVSEVQAGAEDIAGATITLREALSIVTSGDMVEASKELKELKLRLAVALAEAQAEGGDFAGALATARGITDTLKRALALAKVASELVQCDGVDCSPPP